MPYCLSCGKLRRTYGGFCEQCAADMRVRKQSDAQCSKVKIMRNVMREKRGEADDKA